MPCTAFTPSTDKVALTDSLISNHFLRLAVSATLKNSYIQRLEYLRAAQVSAIDFKQIQKASTFLIPVYQHQEKCIPKTPTLLSSCHRLPKTTNHQKRCRLTTQQRFFYTGKHAPKGTSHF